MSEIVQKLAGFTKEIVDGYVNQGSSLEDGIVKVASRENLNTDEIKRLVESSNTLTWLSTVKPSMDKTAEFDIASYPSVMSRIQGPTSDLSYDVDGTSYQVVEDQITKVAEEVMRVESYETLKTSALESLSDLEKTACKSEVSGFLDKTAAKNLNNLGRSEFDLKVLYEETKHELADTIEKLASNLSRLYSEPFNNFEKKAYAMYKSTDVKPVLDLVFNQATFEKEGCYRVEESEAARLADFPFYHEDSNIELVKEAMEYVKGMVNIKRLLTEKTAEFTKKKGEYSKLLSGWRG